MKTSLDKIINNFNERLFTIEMAVVESRRTMSLILKKLDRILANDDIMSDAEEFLLDGEPDLNLKNSPDSVYIEECFNQLMKSKDGLSALREFEKELEKYSDEITGMGES
jgi:hypothetical protein